MSDEKTARMAVAAKRARDLARYFAEAAETLEDPDASPDLHVEFMQKTSAAFLALRESRSDAKLALFALARAIWHVADAIADGRPLGCWSFVPTGDAREPASIVVEALAGGFPHYAVNVTDLAPIRRAIVDWRGKEGLRGFLLVDAAMSAGMEPPNAETIDRYLRELKRARR